MKIKQIMATIRQLAMSQGFYGRLLNMFLDIRENNPEKWSEVVEILEGQHFADPVDMVLYFEG